MCFCIIIAAILLVLWFAYSLLMHGTNYNFKLEFLPNLASYAHPTMHTILLAGIATTDCAILAFESGMQLWYPKHTVSSNLNTPVSANLRLSFDS